MLAFYFSVGVKTQLCFYALHTIPSRKWSFSKTPFKPEEFENAGFVFKCWSEDIFI